MKIAVVGDGVAAALAGAMLARTGIDVMAVPTGDGGTGLGPFGPAVIGSPDWLATEIASALGPVRGAGYAMGLGFSGWAGPDSSWFLPYSDIGAPLGTLPFLQVANRLRDHGHAVRLADFALAARAAAAGRFAVPSPDPRSPFSALEMAMLCPADALARDFRALTPVATRPPLRTVEVADGRLSALVLDDGSTLSADLYVDATDVAARLSAPLGEAWESWRQWLPCNRAAVTAEAEPRQPPPYVHHVATPDGWTATLPLDGLRVETRYSVDGAGVPYENGLRRAAWRGNVVAIGAAAGLVEPVLGTALLLAHNALSRLVGLLPHASDHLVEAAEFNRLHVSEHERARDAAVALWATNGRIGEPLWDGARGVAPDPLDWKLQLYRSRGRVPLLDDEVLSRCEWTALFDGQGLRPRRADPLAAAVSDAAVHAHAARLHRALDAAVGHMPTYADQLARLRAPR